LGLLAPRGIPVEDFAAAPCPKAGTCCRDAAVTKPACCQGAATCSQAPCLVGSCATKDPKAGCSALVGTGCGSLCPHCPAAAVMGRACAAGEQPACCEQLAVMPPRVIAPATPPGPPGVAVAGVKFAPGQMVMGPLPPCSPDGPGCPLATACPVPGGPLFIARAPVPPPPAPPLPPL